MSNPIKSTLKTEGFASVLIIISFLMGFYFYQHFPVRVATHWDWRGNVNGYSSAAGAAFIFPALMLGIYLLLLFIPYLDPKKREYASFAAVYHQFKNLILVFLFIFFILIGWNGLGHNINIGFWTPLLIGVLFVVIGVLLTKVKMNWFVGIRTPWTLSSETVWDKTHQASAKVMAVAGILMAATVLVSSPPEKLTLFILAIATIIITLPLYSYILFRREEKDKKISGDRE
jgi:uncharacterized membrane protein